MPWFQLTPSIADYEFWKWERFNGVRLVAKWPHPNTVRIDPRFRIMHSRPELIPQASRWGVVYYERTLDYDPLLEDRNGIGWFDFETRGDNHIGVSTGPDKNLYSLEIDVESFDVLPFLNGPGVRMDILATHPSFGEQHQTGEWLDDPAQIHWRYNMNTNFWHGSGRWTHFEADPGWPSDLEFDIWAVNECYPFVQTPVGMASMNGTDAYIELDHFILQDSGPSFFEADLRLRQDDWNSFLAPQAASTNIAIVQGEGAYGSRRLDLPDLPAFDVWFKYRIEFEWSSGLQLNYKAWIDDVLQDEITGNRVTTFFDRIGVRTWFTTPIWGNFDIKNLLFKRGSFASPITVLDMPLIENALDRGPDANHGTTFNMDLPSV